MSATYGGLTRQDIHDSAYAAAKNQGATDQEANLHAQRIVSYVFDGAKRPTGWGEA